jgi:hypothetical protein
MKKVLKVAAIVIAGVAAFAVWQLVSSGIIGTPEVPVSELNYNTQQHCSKAAIVKGKVTQHIGDAGYEIEQGGSTLRLAVPKQGSKTPPLPAVGKNIEAHVFVACSSGTALVMGNSFSELP